MGEERSQLEQHFQRFLLQFLNDSINAKKMGELGRKFVIENFSWEIIAKRFINDVKNLL